MIWLRTAWESMDANLLANCYKHVGFKFGEEARDHSFILLVSARARRRSARWRFERVVGHYGAQWHGGWAGGFRRLPGSMKWWMIDRMNEFRSWTICCPRSLRLRVEWWSLRRRRAQIHAIRISMMKRTMMRAMRRTCKVGESIIHSFIHRRRAARRRDDGRRVQRYANEDTTARVCQWNEGGWVTCQRIDEAVWKETDWWPETVIDHTILSLNDSMHVWIQWINEQEYV